MILFLNQIFGDGIDLNDYDLSFFFAGGTGASPTIIASTTTPQCTLLSCLNSSSLNILNTNTATVTNSVIVRASTGSNMASSTGDAVVDTGNAYAAANVVNLVNTNIINSSYLLVSFNNFGDLNDNITLPGGVFFERLFANGSATSSMNSSTYTVDNVNNFALTGTTTAEADTGDNIASTTTDFATTTTSGSGIVTTGDAYSSSNTFNQANTNSVGGTSIFMVFRVAGHWGGNIIGLPAGITTVTIPDGNGELIQFVSSGASTTPATEWLRNYNSSHFLSAATSTATVENNVDVSADTGDNEATTGTGTSTVTTGNAYAAASVVNLVNTNIVGQNWIFAVFNILGNLNGDIIFGSSPNLSVNVSPSTASTAPGSDVGYTFTVTNSGSADANDVILNASFDNTLLTFAPFSGINATSTDTGKSWDIGLVPKGQSRTFTFTARVGNNFPAGASATVPLSAAAVNDNITSPSTSNTANAPIVVSSPAPSTASTNNGGGGGGGGAPSGFVGGTILPAAPTIDPRVTIVKTQSLSTSTLPATVDYKVVIKNEKTAGPAYNAILTDVLRDPSGAVMIQRAWNLDTVASGDEITLTYSIAYSATSTPGIYTNTARVTGQKGNSVAVYANDMPTVEDSQSVQLTAGGQVLGVATSASVSSASSSGGQCKSVLTGYIATGRRNKTSDVLALQIFLNSERKAGLIINGVYDRATITAVNRFQTDFASEILAPARLKKPTGNVYASTVRKINAIKCPGGVAVSTTATSIQATSSTAFMIKNIATSTVSSVKKSSRSSSKQRVATVANKAPKPVTPTAVAVSVPNVPKKNGIFNSIKSVLSW